MNPLYFLYNPKAKRDKNGRVITDIRRKLNSKRTEKILRDGIKSRGQIDYTTGGRKFKVGIKGNVNLKGDKK